MKKAKKNIAPQLTEFTDADGKRWIQTSKEDLFSVKELNEILESVEKDKEEGDIVLARIDFQRVDREYYETVKNLQLKLKSKNEILKRLITESRATVERKNKKLKELIEYIKKLHILLAYYRQGPETADGFRLAPDFFAEPVRPPEAFEEIETPSVGYSEVKEIILDDEGEESG